MIKYKRIKLIPTPFILKVLYGTPDEIEYKLNSVYRGKYDVDDVFKTSDAFVDKVEVGGYPEIIMCLTRLTPGLVSHESEHVIYLMNELIGNEFTKQSQELHSYYLQYLVDEIMKLK